MSSLEGSKKHPAKVCIDGWSEKLRGGSNMCQTKAEEAPWFAIDYGCKVSVAKVVLSNRGDNNGKCPGCSKRTADVEVRLSDEKPADRAKMFKNGHLLATY